MRSEFGNEIACKWICLKISRMVWLDIQRFAGGPRPNQPHEVKSESFSKRVISILKKSVVDLCTVYFFGHFFVHLLNASFKFMYFIFFSVVKPRPRNCTWCFIQETALYIWVVFYAINMLYISNVIRNDRVEKHLSPNVFLDCEDMPVSCAAGTCVFGWRWNHRNNFFKSKTLQIKKEQKAHYWYYGKRRQIKKWKEFENNIC